MSTFWLVFQPLRYRCFPFLFHYHQWSVSTESPPFFFLLVVNKNTIFFFWTQLFNLSLLFKRRGTMRSVLGSFPAPTGEYHTCFLLFSPFSPSPPPPLFPGTSTPYCIPLAPVPSLRDPPTPQNRALWVSWAAPPSIVYPAPVVRGVLPLHPCLSGFSPAALHRPVPVPPLPIVALRALLCLSCGGARFVLSCSCMLASCLSF